MLPVSGWDSSAEWTGYIPFDQLPHTYNPPAGFVATANNRIVGADYPFLISNDWAPPYRAQRITDLIEQFSEGDKISLDDMAAIQADRTSLQVPELLPFLQSVPPADDRQRQAAAYLQSWQGELALDSVAATIYEAWMLHLERAIFEDDLRGDLYDEMSTSANPTFLSNVLNDPGLRTAWCDNVLTVGIETCEQTALVALDAALDDLAGRAGADMAQWRWSKIHNTQYPHRPFSEVSYLKPLFHRSIGNGGDRFTVNVAPVNLETPYDQTHVPGYRHIVDLSNLQNSRFIQTTGQSGNLLSSHYDDFIRPHRDVEYIPMAFGRPHVAGDTLTLEP
jgi:penicillin amidase